MSSFSFGLRVFLRTQNAQADLHYVDLSSARELASIDPLVFMDSDNNIVGTFITSAVSFIIPLVPEPASSAKN